MTERCVCCGAIIPEGVQICRRCNGMCSTCKWLDDVTSICGKRGSTVDRRDCCQKWEEAPWITTVSTAAPKHRREK